MADTGPPWNLRFPGPQDFVRETNFYIEDLAEDTAAGLSAAGNAGIGSNVVQTVKTDSFTTTSTSFVDVPGVSVTITPTTDTAKVLVLVQYVMANAVASRMFLQLRRGSTNIATGTSGTAQATQTGAVNTEWSNQGAIIFLDSPGVDTATTYSIQFRVSNGTGFIGRNSFVNESAVTTITAIEVEA